MNKILVVNKPKGKTSYELVREYKKKLGIAKIGHAGTLDPFASGILILLVGKATKKFKEFMEMEKEYEMVVRLGLATDTGDRTGKTIKQLSNEEIKGLKITRKKIDEILQEFIGKQEQGIPIYSAKKVRGKPLYWYARKGKKIKGGRKIVEIKNIKLLWFKRPDFKIRVICSSGTYMRQLAVDIGKKLGLPSVAWELKRTRIGKYTLFFS